MIAMETDTEKKGPGDDFARALGKPKDDAADEEDHEGKEAAAQEIIDAVKGGDAHALMEALDAYAKL